MPDNGVPNDFGAPSAAQMNPILTPQQGAASIKQAAGTALNTGPLDVAKLTPETVQSVSDYLVSKLPSIIQTPVKVAGAPARAVEKTALGALDWMTRPAGISQLAAAAIPVTKIPMAIKFFYDMASGAGQEAAAMVDKFQQGDYQGFADALAGTIANTLGAGALGVHTAGGIAPKPEVRPTVSGATLKTPQGAVPPPEPDFSEALAQPPGAALPVPPKMEEQLNAAEISISPGMRQTITDKKIKSPVALQRVFPNLNVSLEEAQEIVNQVWNKNDNVNPKYLPPDQQPPTPPAPVAPAKPLSTIGEAAGDVFDKLNLPESQGNGLPSTESTKNAPVAEARTPAQSSTSIKNDVVDEERAQRGLPPAVEPARRSFGTVWDDAMWARDKDPNIQTDLIKELREKPRALTDQEDALLLQRQIELQNQHQKATAELNAAKDAGNDALAKEHQIHVARLSDDLLDLYNINKTSGTETGRGLAARRMMANEDYSLAQMQTRLRAAKGGDKLTPAESSHVQELAGRVQSLQKQLDDHLAKTQADDSTSRYSPYILQMADKITGVLETRANAARARIKARYSGKLGADVTGAKAVATSLAALRDEIEIGAYHIAKIGTDFGKWSQAMLGEFGERVRPHLQAMFSESQKQADKISEAASPKNEKVRDAVKTRNARIASKTAQLEEKVARGDVSKPARKTIPLDPTGVKLKAAYENAKLQFDRLVVAEQLKSRTMFQKTQDTFSKWRRAFLLSSPVTLAKLTAAAIERGVITPAEEVVGGVYSQIPGLRGVAKRAPREGGMSVTAEAKSIVEGFTKGMSDARKSLTTGHSDLDSLYGKRELMPRELIDFIGSIHGALKAPVKRAEFARSMQKRMEFAIRNGQDVTDPLIQTKIAVAAFKDAQRAIFMQDNKVTAAWQAGLKILESPDKQTGKIPAGRKVLGTAARAVLPIVKVPTNIVGETIQYSTGWATGPTRLLAAAIKDGTKSLTPEEADLIMREFKKGSLGGALLLTGYFAPQMFGGYYQQNDKSTNHPKFGSVKIAGHNIPSMLVHNPLLETMQIGATIRHVADSKLRKKDGTPQGIGAGILAGVLGLADEVPFIQQPLQLMKAFNPYERAQFLDQFARDMIVPLGIDWVAKHFDKDAQGHYVARQQNTFEQTIQSAIPLLRERLPIDAKKTRELNR